MNELITYLKREWSSLNRLEKTLLPVVVTVLFVLFTGQALYSAAISGTNVAAPVVPFDTADTYPTHNARYGKGGLVQFQTTSLCRQIPIQRRYTGMMCYAAATDSWRYLKNGTANTNWQRAPIIPVVGVDIFDGRPAPPPLFATLSGGARSHTYDASPNGANPLPAPWAFKVKLYSGGVTVIPTRYAWSTCPNGLLSGTGTAATFTPKIQQNYSANRSTCVQVQLTYSTSAILGAKRIVTAGTPIVTNKIGQQGVPGQDATVTEAAVVSAFAATASNNPLVMRTTSGTQSKFEIWDTSNNTRTWFDTLGNQYWMMANGDTVVKILTDGSFIVMRGGVKRAEVLNNGTIATYHTNGTTKSFGNYSNGSYYGKEGLPASNGLCMSRDMTTGIVSYITCGSGGSGTPGGSNKQLQYNNNGSFGGAAFARYSVWANGLGGTLIVTGGMVVK